MALYDYWKNYAQPMGSPKPGAFWLYAKVDFKNGQVMSANDAVKIMKIKDKWVIRDSYWRCTTATTGSATFDIGCMDGGGSTTQTDQGILAGGASTAGDWAQGVAQSGAVISRTADGYVFLENLTATSRDGIVEVMLEIVAGPDDAEPVDMNIDD